MLTIFLALLGLCWGSFVNAAVWRLHQQETQKRLTATQRRKLSIVHGRSMCTHCRHVLAWYDLLPLVSWLALGGACRYCRKPIGWQYPVVESLTAATFVISYLVWPYGFDAAGWVLFGFWLIYLVGFMALAVYDLRWMLLPNRIVYSLIVLTVLQVLFKLFVYDDASVVLGEAFWGFIAIGGLFYALFQVSGGRWIGGGDVKLGFMIGPLVGGPLNSVLVIFLASCVGSLVSLPMMVRKTLKPTSRIPFGPFLLLATVIVYLWGSRIVDISLNLL